ncbi:arginine--tRNA ligase [Spiroplasma endosymbiont of Crioceris asparagi]|uniref:arginine--tRNA ligase n=1 Tax=Spiroplasma endosymbiont of Crioceris asparagi TaxID=3066286 RepID=UPI0030CA86E5
MALIYELENLINNIVTKNKLKGKVIVEKTKSFQNGHFSTNFALINAKVNQLKPIELANTLIDLLKKETIFSKVEIAGQGFINLFLKEEYIFKKVFSEIESQDLKYGSSKSNNKKISIELVSANPTGYLHIGHARNGVIGDVIARIMRFAGYDVETEYYTNDFGNQINISAATLFYFYKKALNQEIAKPEEMYEGDIYIKAGEELKKEIGDKYANNIIKDNKIVNPEVHEFFKSKSINFFLKIIKEHLKLMDINIEKFISEKSMYDSGAIQKTLDFLSKNNASYEKDGAIWLKSTTFGDDKDRVLVKSDGSFAYILPDLASQWQRFKRENADEYIFVWGADHHGYVPRMKAGLQLLGEDGSKFVFEIIQMVSLTKAGKEFKMSKRAGTAVWLIDLYEMVGKDGIRYMMASKNSNTHMNFDIDLITQKSLNNPIFYLQYATARANQIIMKAEENNIKPSKNVNLLTDKKEIELILQIDNFQKIVRDAAVNKSPNLVCDYVQNICKLFHSNYNSNKIIDTNNLELSAQRLNLVYATYKLVRNVFNLLGLDVVNKM